MAFCTVGTQAHNRRAFAQVSDLLREQFLLQSELSDDRHASAPPLSPGPGAGEHPRGAAVYRASINITPVPPPRSDRRRDEEGAGGEEAALGTGRGDGDALRRLMAEVRALRSKVNMDAECSGTHFASFHHHSLSSNSFGGEWEKSELIFKVSLGFKHHFCIFISLIFEGEKSNVPLLRFRSVRA